MRCGIDGFGPPMRPQLLVESVPGAGVELSTCNANGTGCGEYGPAAHLSQTLIVE